MAGSEVETTKKKIKEKANLDPKTKTVFERKGYEVMDKISEGAFGKVYTSINKKKGEMAAVKVMDLDKCGEKFKEKFLPRELAIIIQIRHPSVVHVYDIFKANHKIFIFMEFCPNGTLADVVKKNGPVAEPKVKFWYKQCTEALNHMHTNLGICHRDIKVENVLLDVNNNAKLSDFGFAKEVVVNGEVQLSSTFCGTEPYYCPELVKRREDRTVKLEYNPFRADVWAMGVMLFAMLNNKFPYHFDKRMLDEQLNYRYKYRPTVEDLLSENVKNLIRRCLEVDPPKRITTVDMLAHKWMTS
ncbi:Testis-specific serine/threonine-protein kinase 4 [Halotydeus destructor]|nr:Testis-specific serine/threonine-protein kinase 4 [Halotydeus destructor]